MIGRVIAIAVAACAMLAVTTDAEAAKGKKARAVKDKSIVTFSGCARFAPPFCTVVGSRGTTYVLHGAQPPIPIDTGISGIGKKTGDVGICFGTQVQVISWKPNRLACKR
jgi:hypothetical protein